MTRIDMTTRQLHELLKPVLPHTIDDSDNPELSKIRIEARERSVVAVATDRYTLAAERHTLAAANAVYDPPPPIAIHLSDAKAALALFKFSKDDDPPLRITIDSGYPIPVALADASAIHPPVCRALAVEDRDGRRIVLRDVLDPSFDPLANWRATLRGMLARKLIVAPPALCLQAAHLARWQGAVRKGERLAVYSGDRELKPLLVLVEHHFAGVWQTVAYLDGPAQMLAESPWRYELAAFHDELDGQLDGPPVIAPECARGDHDACWDDIDTGPGEHPCECPHPHPPASPAHGQEGTTADAH